MKRILISVILISFTIPCSAQWKNALFEAQVLAFGVHDTSFFVSDVPGNTFHLVYRFTPSKPSLWVGADNGIDPTQGYITSFASLGNYFFAGMTNGPSYLSTNNGSQWSGPNAGGPIATNGRYIFSGTGGYGIYRSSDSGATWDSINRFSVNSFGANGSYIFATSGDTIWRSMDNGNTWSKISPPFTGTITVMGSLLFLPGNGKLAESSDNGSNWNTVTVDSAGVPENAQCLATDGKNLFAGTPTGVLVSTDSGRDWQAENDGLTYKDISAIGVFDTLLFIDVSSDLLINGFAAYYRPIREITNGPDAVAPTASDSTILTVYPNPVRNSATIAYTLAAQSRITLTIVDALGRTVAFPVSGETQGAGRYSIDFDASNLPSGMYWCRLSTGNEEKFSKFILER